MRLPDSSLHACTAANTVVSGALQNCLASQHPPACPCCTELHRPVCSISTMTLAVLLQSLYRNEEEDDLELQGGGSNGQQHSMGNGKPALGGNGQMDGSLLPACPANRAAGQAVIWVAAPGHSMTVLPFCVLPACRSLCKDVLMQH